MGALNKNSATGTRTRVARVRAEYPNQLDYSGLVKEDLAGAISTEVAGACQRGPKEANLASTGPMAAELPNSLHFVTRSSKAKTTRHPPTHTHTDTPKEN